MFFVGNGSNYVGCWLNFQMNLSNYIFAVADENMIDIIVNRREIHIISNMFSNDGDKLEW